MGTGMEALIVGNCVLHKAEQNVALAQDYKTAFTLD
jgi:carbamoyltransferase